MLTSSFAHNPFRIKIYVNSPSFEKYTSAVNSDLKSVNRAGFEEHLLSFEPKGISFDIEIQPFFFPGTSESAFEDDFSTSTSLEEIITNCYNEEKAKPDEFLSSAAEDSTAFLYFSFKKYFFLRAGSATQKIDLLLQLYRSKSFFPD